jgi:hypothetical protein
MISLAKTSSKVLLSSLGRKKEFILLDILDLPYVSNVTEKKSRRRHENCWRHGELAPWLYAGVH